MNLLSILTIVATLVLAAWHVRRICYRTACARRARQINVYHS